MSIPQRSLISENQFSPQKTTTHIYDFNDIKSLVAQTSIQQTQISSNTKKKQTISNLSNLPEKQIYDHAVNALKQEDIPRIQNYFLTKQERYTGTNIRDYTLFMVGVNIAERISDLLKLQVKDVINPDGTIVDTLTIIPKKTSRFNKTSFIALSPVAKEVLDVYLSHRWDNKDEEIAWDIEDYLFYNYRTKEQMTRKAAWQIMNNAKIALDIDYSIGTHFMRKTWSKTTLLNSDDPNTFYRVMERLNHTKPEDTKRYLKMDKEETIAFMNKTSIGDINKLKELYC